VHFIVNAEPESHGARFARAHGPSACAMAFRVKDAGKAYRLAIDKGAKPHEGKSGRWNLTFPRSKGSAAA
jgi:4-hydroxyphenylpyruvate dioxygenase